MISTCTLDRVVMGPYSLASRVVSATRVPTSKAFSTASTPPTP